MTEKGIGSICCFTGHRPEKLRSSEADVRGRLAGEIAEAIKAGYDTFITGMVEGVDVWAAEEVIRLKEKHKELKLVCAVPFDGVERDRTKEEQERFRTIIGKADEVTYICPKYRPWCFGTRDRWMVDRSSRVIAVFSGCPGGTEHTIKYAKEKNRTVILIEDKQPDIQKKLRKGMTLLLLRLVTLLGDIIAG